MAEAGRPRAGGKGWLAALVRTLLAVALAAPAAAALRPEQVLVVANRHAPEGLEVAAYYLRRRHIPAANLLTLWAPTGETCTRKEYEQRILGPVQERLRAPGGAELRAVVVCFGVPLKVGPPPPTAAEKERIAGLEMERGELRDPARDGDRDAVARDARLEQIAARLKQLRHADSGAALDSELMLARLATYPLAGWIPNPLYRDVAVPGAIPRWEVLIVARLDGPTAGIARRLVDDALAAEAEGLSGGAYLDARWAEPPPGKRATGYASYDRSLHRAAALLRRRGWKVTLDATSELFPSGAALPAALYSGWYRLARYVDAFRWQRGAVGYHIASSEAATLRAGDSQVWCKRMLEEGVAATLGPVAEPYVQAFPPPELFFDLLTRGMSLGDAYVQSVPYLSWQMVLLGDPLYRVSRREAALGAQGLK